MIPREQAEQRRRVLIVALEITEALKQEAAMAAAGLPIISNEELMERSRRLLCKLDELEAQYKKQGDPQ